MSDSRGIEPRRAWIANLLDRSVRAWLYSLAKDHVTKTDLNVTFNEDLSNLRIILRSPFAECAQLVELHSTSGCSKATLADTRNSVRACFSTKAIEEWESDRSRPKVVESPRGTIFRILHLEIRINHCLEPPKPELWIQSFEILDHDSAITKEIQSMQTVSEVAFVRERLTEYMATRLREKSPLDGASSPGSIASQVSNQMVGQSLRHSLEDSDSESLYFPSISQAGFSTQFHALQEPKLKKPLKEPASSMVGKEKVLQILQGHSREDRRHPLVRKRERSPKAGNEDPLSRNLPPDQAARHQERVSQINGLKAPRDAGSSSFHSSARKVARFSITKQSIAKDVDSDQTSSGDLNSSLPVKPFKNKSVEGARNGNASVNKSLTSRDQISAEAEPPQHPMTPAPSTSQFWRWREDILSVGYIPRYATRIAKDQDALLVSNDSWQPPLVGQTVRDGPVPLNLLNRLTEIVDNVSSLQKPSDGPVSAYAENHSHSLLDLSRTVLSGTGCKSNEQTREARETTRPSTSSSSAEVGLSQWPQSPPNPPRVPNHTSENVSPLKTAETEASYSSSSPSPLQQAQLPPNSSPPIIALEELESHNDRIQSPSLSQIDSDVSNYDEAGQLSEDNKGIPKNRGDNGRRNRHNNRSFVAPQVPTNKPTSLETKNQFSSSVETTSVLHSSQKSIQVKRTPYHHKALSSTVEPTTENRSVAGGKTTAVEPAGSATGFSDSSPPFVAGTFAAQVVPKVPNDLVQSKSANSPVSSTAQPNKFEVDSSEEEAVVREGENLSAFEMESRLKRQPILRRSPQQHSDELLSPKLFSSGQRTGVLHRLPGSRRVDFPADFKRHQVHDISVEIDIPASSQTNRREATHLKTKRGLNESLIELSRAKRLKTMPLPRPDVKSGLESDYAAVSNLIRVQRREFFLGQKSRPISARSVSPPISPYQDASDSLYAWSEHRRASGQSFVSVERNPVSTPVTNPSVDHDMIAEQEKHSGSRRDFAILRSTYETLQETFQIFSAEYSDYEGEFGHFEKACHFISDLQIEGKAPHPSLWDDFIFRHHHDYRRYLLDIIEASGSAVSFDRYYDEFVEEPQYLKRIVKASLLNSIRSKSTISGGFTSPLPDRSSHNRRDLTGSNTAASDTNNVRAIIKTQEHHLNLATGQISHIETPVSTVNLWLQKAAGAESPELGTPSVEKEDVEIPMLDIGASTSTLVSRPEHPEAHKTPPKSQAKIATSRRPLWWEQDNTSFKKFARKHASLPCENGSKEKQMDRESVLQPDLQRFIDIFDWRA